MAEGLLVSQNGKTMREVGQHSRQKELHFTMHTLATDLVTYLSGQFCIRPEDTNCFNPVHKTRHFSYTRAKCHGLLVTDLVISLVPDLRHTSRRDDTADIQYKRTIILTDFVLGKDSGLPVTDSARLAFEQKREACLQGRRVENCFQDSGWIVASRRTFLSPLKPLCTRKRSASEVPDRVQVPPLDLQNSRNGISMKDGPGLANDYLVYVSTQEDYGVARTSLPAVYSTELMPFNYKSYENTRCSVRRVSSYPSKVSSDEGSHSNQHWALDKMRSHRKLFAIWSLISSSLRCTHSGTSSKSTPMMHRGPAGPRTVSNACGLKWANKMDVVLIMILLGVDVDKAFVFEDALKLLPLQHLYLYVSSMSSHDYN
ncbi:hypothetical protein FNV43_RR22195 [Rhamnella rubrinervis]|uniref:GATA-type domain-containing protein n=1 Tax=Rhamnella rubrinervis TaxID=2594499 RepID=A0A8K0DVQ7_9ROSA|nr:hypothetical protein FNV43_RR22195 [Rhamnella rubrinervis]